ncbi:MAG: NAD(P)/FAD-dependent oxidoreductase [Thermoplasmatota archaeon]
MGGDLNLGIQFKDETASPRSKMEFDHVVVGAGVIGSATAFHLKSMDPDSNILLLERENRAGAGNTAKSAALYRNIFSTEISRKMATSSIRYYLSLGDKVQIKPIGYLWLFSEDQWKASSPAVNTLDPRRDELEFIEDADIKKMLKINTAGVGKFPGVDHGIWGHLCGSLSGMGLAQHYAESFKELGGELRYDTEIDELRLRGKGSRHAPWDDKGIEEIADSSGNTISAKDYIFAVGAWSQELLGEIGVFTGVLPKKRQLFGIRIDDPGQVASGMELDKVPALILPAGGAYIKPILDRKLMILGLADDLGQPYDMRDPGYDEDYFKLGIEPVIGHYFPLLRDYELKMRWAGYYAYHWPDKNPVIENIANLFWSSGTSGSGIMKADALGRITAGRVLGKSNVSLFDGTIIASDILGLRDRRAGMEKFVI